MGKLVRQVIRHRLGLAIACGQVSMLKVVVLDFVEITDAFKIYFEQIFII